MQTLGVFDIFKIGVGPSSSHTMGPWNAAREFAAEFCRQHPASIQVELYGSLAKTGRGHATDVALILGLAGYDAKTIDVDAIDSIVAGVKESKTITLGGGADHDGHAIPFDPRTDIRFCTAIELPTHPNAMKFIGTSVDGSVMEQIVYSIGGGFIVRDGERVETVNVKLLPLPVQTAADMLRHCREHNLSIADVVRTNELSQQEDAAIGEAHLNAGLDELAAAMIASVHRGCRVGGMLPGMLSVRRRAKAMATNCAGEDCPDDVDAWIDSIRSRHWEFAAILDWVSCFALAVNEENAAMGRVVTAPTNGAAGVIPAVLMYHLCFCGGDRSSTRRFLMTASEIGCLFKKGATISAAMGGCQAEIGVSSAMAAAALCEFLGGGPRHAAMAAEIAMEHHLGMTCDPIGGLVQIPCIERNAMGAIKAITAAQLAMRTDPDGARVSLDDVVRTMWATAQDMNSKYKETSEGGLAVQIAVNLSEC